jgi:hypothetical protein
MSGGGPAESTNGPRRPLPAMLPDWLVSLHPDAEDEWPST